MAEYSAEEQELISEMWLLGHHARDIIQAVTEKFGITRSIGAISVQAGRWGLPPRHAGRRKVAVGDESSLGDGEALYKTDANPNSKKRPCITCRTIFLSQHAGNRMCDPCRSGDGYDGVSYVESYSIGAVPVAWRDGT